MIRTRSRTKLFSQLQVLHHIDAIKLIHLPSELFTIILSEYLHLQDICSIDIAICSHHLRPLWLHCLQNYHSQALEDIEHTHRSIRWLIKRHIQVKSIILKHLRCNHFDVREDTFQNISMSTLESFNARLFDDAGDITLFDITDTCLLQLAKGCPNLKHIYLGDFIHFTSLGIKALTKSCQKLESIGFFGVNQNRIPSLIDLIKLFHNNEILKLIIFECDIDEEFLNAIIKYFPHLREFNFCTNIITGFNNSCLNIFADAYPQIRNIEFVADRQLSLSTFTHFLSNCKHIQSLNVCYDNWKDEWLGAIGANCKFLETFRMSRDILSTTFDSSVSDEGIRLLTAGCSSLRKLMIVDYCPLITDLSTHYLVDHCPKLQSVVLSGCQNISEDGITLLLEGCKYIEDFSPNLNFEKYFSSHVNPTLISLSFNYDESITNPDIKSVVLACPNLETLRLVQCVELTNTCFRYLKKLRHLRLLDIYRSFRLDKAKAKDALPGVKVIDYHVSEGIEEDDVSNSFILLIN